MRARHIAGVVGLLLASAVGYLGCWPIDADPHAWTPPPNPSGNAPWEDNEVLANVEPLHGGALEGPEDIAVAPDGRLYTGLADGRIVRFDANGGELQDFVHIDGRPLGMEFAPDGTLWVANGHGGLLAFDAAGTEVDRVDAVNGAPLVFADDLTIAGDGTVWFSEASTRFSPEKAALDAVEGNPTGRLLSYDPRTKETRVRLEGLRYANGVVMGPDDAFVLVVETFGYRVARLWLKGERAGEGDLFAQGFAGLPDNITKDAQGRYWVALIKRRSAILDAISPHPSLRRALMRVPEAWLPVPPPMAYVAVLDPEGQVLGTAMGTDGSFGDITSATALGDTLWLGSLSMTAVGRVAVPKLSPDR